ncbi:MAG: hypothetical protein WCO35_01810 [Candidatus Nomurabacteria bacterium]
MKQINEKEYLEAKKVVDMYELQEKIKKQNSCNHPEHARTLRHMSNSQSIHYYYQCDLCNFCFPDWEEPA